MGIYDRDYYQEDEVRPLRPWDNNSMVNLLILANFALFVANFLFSSRTSAFTYSISLVPEDITSPTNFWHLLSNGFAHYDIWHIIFNMLALYFLGRSVEDRLGKWEFFRFYIATLLICSAAWAGIHYGEPVRLLGASGATTAVSMLFVFMFPQARLLFMMAIPVPAWVIGIVIVVTNLVRPTAMQLEGGATTAYDVHLIGVGLAAAYFFLGLSFRGVGDFFSGLQQRRKIKRSNLKVHRPEDKRATTPKEDAESDRILAKISSEGQDSLTNKERKFLESYSRKVRQGRDR